MISRLLAGLLLGALTCGAAAAARRAPAAAGRFYPADPAELAGLVESHFKAAGAPAFPGRLVALIAPHAGLVYSGAVAAKALAAARGLDPEVVVVLGTGHTKPVDGAAIFPGPYAVPGATFEYDAALGKDLVKRSRAIVIDAQAHEKEHSIELVLPYIKSVAPRAKLVAMVLNTQGLEPAREVGRALAEALAGKRALIVASSDLSHYPPKDVATAVDGATLEAAARLDPAFFWLANRLLLTRGVKSLSVAWCGEAAVTATLEAAARLGARSLHVLARADSSHAGYDAMRVVGYAAAALTTAEPAPDPHSPAERAELIRLARAAVLEWLKTGAAPIPAIHPLARLNVPAAVFVTLRDAKGALRGCMGTTRAEAPLHEAVARSAVAAAVSDNRFKPVAAQEFSGLALEVTVLGPRHLTAAADVRPGDGVALELGAKTGVFLPEVWDALPGKDDFLGELCAQKAGLERGCWKDPRARLFTFSGESIRL